METEQEFIGNHYLQLQAERGGRASRPGHLAPISGVSVRYFATVQSRLEPIQHFVFNPSHPVGTKLNPLWEIARLFQPCDVLG